MRLADFTNSGKPSKTRQRASERSTHPSTQRHIPEDLNPMWDPIWKSPWELYNLKWGPLLWIRQPYIAHLSPHCVHNSTSQNLNGGSWIHPQSWNTTTFIRCSLILSVHARLHRTTVMPFSIFIPLCVLHVPSIISPTTKYCDAFQHIYTVCVLHVSSIISPTSNYCDAFQHIYTVCVLHVPSIISPTSNYCDAFQHIYIPLCVLHVPSIISPTSNYCDAFQHIYTSMRATCLIHHVFMWRF